MEFNTRQELYDYLNSFNFDSVRDTKLSSVYFLIEIDDDVEPIYFTSYEDVWFESPCNLYAFPLKDDDLVEYVTTMYYDGYSFEECYEFERHMQKNGWHYDIDCPQCSPFLPDKIKIVDVFSDIRCLDWLLNR